MRKIGTRQKKSPIPTIIGAGITEQWYFSHLQSLFGFRMKIRPRFFGTETATRLSKKIEEVLQCEGFAIAVFDDDVSTWNKVEKKKLEAMRRKYSNNPNVLLCDSLPSIEYWFLLHYEETNKYFGTSEAVIRDLKKHLDIYNKSFDYLRHEKWVSEMSNNGKLDDAISRAKANGVDGESFSNVYKAIEKIK